MIDLFKHFKDQEVDTPDNWCLWVWDTEDDFLLSWDAELPDLRQQDNVYYAYNQKKKSAWSSDCTLFWPITAVSALLNRRFSDDNIEWVRDIAHSRWKEDKKWWYIQMWVKAVCDYVNEHAKEWWVPKVVYYKTPIGSELFWKAIKLKNFAVVWINWNAKLTLDYSDWVLDSKKLDWARTRWHCLCNTISDDDNTKAKAVDNYNSDKTNYIPAKSNEYKIGNNSTFNSDIYQWYAYIITKETTDEEEVERLQKMAVIIKWNVESNSTQWNNIDWIKSLTNDDAYLEAIKEYQAALHKFNDIQRKKFETIKKMLDK